MTESAQWAGPHRSHLSWALPVGLIQWKFSFLFGNKLVQMGPKTTVICLPVEKLSKNLTCITKWEVKGGVTVTLFSAYRYWELDQLFIKIHHHTSLQWVRPNFLHQTQNSDTKLTIVMWCQVFRWEVFSAIQRWFPPQTAATVGLWTRSGIKKTL